MRELEGRRCAADGVECETNTTATDTESPSQTAFPIGTPPNGPLEALELDQ